MNKRHLLEVPWAECNSAARRGARLLSKAVVAAVLTTTGCSDQTRPPPVPPLADATRPMPTDYSDPLLQALARQGALINENARDKDKSTFVKISFVDATIDEATAKNLARFFAAARSTSTKSSRGDRPTYLVFERCRVSREAIAPLDGARRLSHLWFTRTPVNDTTFAGIESLPDLRDLEIGESDIGDDGLRFLAASPRFEALSAYRTRVGDATLARLENAHAMENLELTGTKVTDHGLQIASRFSKLRWLHVANCDITDAGAAHLSRLMNLISLNLDGTRITDAGVRHLRDLDLQDLGLRNTDTSNACLQYLAGMRHLTYLRIGGTRITKAGVAAALRNYPLGYLNTNP